MADYTNNEKIDEKKGKRRTLTILGYVCCILVMLTVFPVGLPPIFGYHTHTLSTDTTGLVSKYGSVVYTKNVDAANLSEGNIAAVKADGESVDVYYVASNDESSKTVTFEDESTASYDDIKGQVVAKTPFIGYLSQLCFSVVGIIIIVLVLAVGAGLMMYANKISKEINTLVEAQKQ